VYVQVNRRKQWLCWEKKATGKGQSVQENTSNDKKQVPGFTSVETGGGETPPSYILGKKIQPSRRGQQFPPEARPKRKTVGGVWETARPEGGVEGNVCGHGSWGYSKRAVRLDRY